VIYGAISANSVQAAPAGLAISAVAAVKGSAAAASTLTLVKGALELMAWTKAKTAATGPAILILVSRPPATEADLVLRYFRHQRMGDGR